MLPDLFYQKKIEFRISNKSNFYILAAELKLKTCDSGELKKVNWWEKWGERYKIGRDKNKLVREDIRNAI